MFPFWFNTFESWYEGLRIHEERDYTVWGGYSVTMADLGVGELGRFLGTAGRREHPFEDRDTGRKKKRKRRFGMSVSL